jgi:hypothetical protein
MGIIELLLIILLVLALIIGRRDARVLVVVVLRA